MTKAPTTNSLTSKSGAPRSASEFHRFHLFANLEQLRKYQARDLLPLRFDVYADRSVSAEGEEHDDAKLEPDVLVFIATVSVTSIDGVRGQDRIWKFWNGICFWFVFWNIK